MSTTSRSVTRTAPATASRRAAADTPAGRTASVGVLLTGAVVATAAAFGSLWLVRLGLVLALLAGAAALALAWRAAGRTLRRVREQHAAQVREQVRAHREELSTERADHLAVLDTLDGRLDAQRQHNEVLEHRVSTLRTQVKGLRREIATLLPEVSSLRGDTAALRDRLAEQDATVTGLRAELACREHELEALTDGEVLTMPRRGVPTAEQIWSDGDHPPVVELRAVGAQAEPGLRRQA